LTRWAISTVIVVGILPPISMWGQIDPVTYTILGQLDEVDSAIHFDYVIMGTSYILEKQLYVESREEAEIKSAILHRAKGEKILVLTKHEFTDHPIEGLQPYGSIGDYEYVIVPVHGNEGEAEKSYERIFAQYRSLFEPEIIHWNYTILKVAERDVPTG